MKIFLWWNIAWQLSLVLHFCKLVNKPLFLLSPTFIGLPYYKKGNEKIIKKNYYFDSSSSRSNRNDKNKKQVIEMLRQETIYIKALILKFENINTCTSLKVSFN